MTPPPAVITVLKCPCGRYIPAGGLGKHLQVCSKLQEDVAASDSDGDEDDTRSGLSSAKSKQDGVLVVEFKSPCVLVEKLSDSEITAASQRIGVLGKTEAIQDANKRTRKRKMKTFTSLKEIDAEDEESEYDECLDESDEDFDESAEKRNARKRRKRSQTVRRQCGVVADEQYNHKCNVCPTKFKSKKDFDWHMLNIHGAKSKNYEIITCPICGRMLNKRLVYHSHLKSHENAEALEDAFDLWNKWPAPTAKSAKATFSCKYCLIPHTSYHSFLTHMKVEHPEKGRFCKYLCQYCGISEFDSMKHFIFHVRTSHLEEYYGKTIKWGLSDPMKQSGRPKGKCDICNKMLDVFYIRSHKERAHKDKINSEGIQGQDDDEETDNSLKCPMPNCYSSFKNRALLKNHFILHLKNNPYKCKFPGCQVQCDAQCHLNRHMKLHASPLIPCPKCGVHYSRIDKLKMHVCCFDSSKLKYDEHGHLRPVNSFSRLKRVQSENVSQNGQEPHKEGATEETKKDISNSKMNLETDNVNEQVQFSKGFKSYKKRVNINAIISTDPVFIQVCEKNPGFKDLILRKEVVRQQTKDNHGRKRKPKPYRRQITECTKCGKVLVNLVSLARHWRLIHGIILKPLHAVRNTNGIKQAGTVKPAKKKKTTAKKTTNSYNITRTRNSKKTRSKGINEDFDCSIVKKEYEPEVHTENCDIIIKSDVPEEPCIIKTEVY